MKNILNVIAQKISNLNNLSIISLVIAILALISQIVFDYIGLISSRYNGEDVFLATVNGRTVELSKARTSSGFQADVFVCQPEVFGDALVRSVQFSSQSENISLEIGGGVPDLSADYPVVITVLMWGDGMEHTFAQLVEYPSGARVDRIAMDGRHLSCVETYGAFGL